MAVLDEDGVSKSAAVVIAYLMEIRNWSFHEAFIFLKECRYVVEVDVEFIDVLVDWKFKQNATKRQYQCLCGACVITVSAPFEQSAFPNPRGCSCKVRFILFLFILFYLFLF